MEATVTSYHIKSVFVRLFQRLRESELNEETDKAIELKRVVQEDIIICRSYVSRFIQDHLTSKNVNRLLEKTNCLLSLLSECCEADHPSTTKEIASSIRMVSVCLNEMDFETERQQSKTQYKLTSPETSTDEPSSGTENSEGNSKPIPIQNIRSRDGIPVKSLYQSRGTKLDTPRSLDTKPLGDEISATKNKRASRSQEIIPPRKITPLSLGPLKVEKKKFSEIEPPSTQEHGFSGWSNIKPQTERGKIAALNYQAQPSYLKKSDEQLFMSRAKSHGGRNVDFSTVQGLDRLQKNIPIDTSDTVLEKPKEEHEENTILESSKPRTTYFKLPLELASPDPGLNWPQPGTLRQNPGSEPPRETLPFFGIRRSKGKDTQVVSPRTYNKRSEEIPLKGDLIDINSDLPKNEKPTQEKFSTPKKGKKQLLYENLPEKAKRKCEQFKLTPEIVQTNIDVVYSIMKFLLPESFPSEDVVTKSCLNLASPLFIEATRAIVEKSPTGYSQKLFSKIHFISSGGFGQVFKAKQKVGKHFEIVAIKKLPHQNQRQKENNLCEIGFLTACRHPNIVTIKGSFCMNTNNGEEIWMVMEYLEGGTLSEAAKSRRLTDSDISLVAREILKALLYLHDNHYVHRDLKSSNVMLSVKGQIKLIDFGLCADFSEGPRKQIVGSPFWIPPEMIKQEYHSYPVDIWSLGVSVLELYEGTPPYAPYNFKCMWLVATEGLLHKIPAHASDDAKDFLTKCLQMDPDARGTAANLLQHLWINQPKTSDPCFSHLLEAVFLDRQINNFK